MATPSAPQPLNPANRVEASLVNRIKQVSAQSVSAASATFPTSFSDVYIGTNDGTATVQSVPATTFTLINLTTVASDPGANFSTTTKFYTVPSTGLYMIFAKIRILDSSTAGNNIGFGVHTSNIDGPWFQWQINPAATANSRQTFNYQRLAYFNAGDQLRMFTYGQTAYVISVASMQILRHA